MFQDSNSTRKQTTKFLTSIRKRQKFHRQTKNKQTFNLMKEQRLQLMANHFHKHFTQSQKFKGYTTQQFKETIFEATQKNDIFTIIEVLKFLDTEEERSNQFEEIIIETYHYQKLVHLIQQSLESIETLYLLRYLSLKSFQFIYQVFQESQIIQKIIEIVKKTINVNIQNFYLETIGNMTVAYLKRFKNKGKFKNNLKQLTNLALKLLSNDSYNGFILKHINALIFEEQSVNKRLIQLVIKRYTECTIQYSQLVETNLQKMDFCFKFLINFILISKEINLKYFVSLCEIILYDKDHKNLRTLQSKQNHYLLLSKLLQKCYAFENDKFIQKSDYLYMKSQNIAKQKTVLQWQIDNLLSRNDQILNNEQNDQQFLLFIVQLARCSDFDVLYPYFRQKKVFEFIKENIDHPIHQIRVSSIQIVYMLVKRNKDLQKYFFGKLTEEYGLIEIFQDLYVKQLDSKYTSKIEFILDALYYMIKKA